MTRRRRIWLVGLLMLVLVVGGCGAKRSCVVMVPTGASALETLAAREVVRYAYVRTGELLPIVTDSDAAPTARSRIVVGSKDRPVVQKLAAAGAGLKDLGDLKPQQYRLRTLKTSAGPVLLIVGGDPEGTLYGAYRFAEHLGVRFYLEGDVAPEQRVAFKLPELDEKGVPLFALRGIQPFHDFPEGPDFWSEDGYKAVLSQLPKLGMNFIGLHTYPEGGVGPEPVVWIGRPEEVNEDGTIKASYPARHFSTVNGTWGYLAGQGQGYAQKLTSKYRCGASMLFEHDAYAQDVQVGMCPWPQTAEQQNELFNRFGRKLHNAFEYAHALGVVTCVGTETPLTVPKEVRERVVAGRTTTQPTADDVQRLYEGMFTRIMKAYPLDYYWFWTSEGWTWGEIKKETVEAAISDIQRAVAAADKVGAKFKLATCGWVLGPQYDRSLFDKVLPKSMAVSCINRAVGHDPVEPGFAKVQGRGKWAIPWLEDDPALIIPQLWVGRMRKDALDALTYGCTGLMGIHWRTRILGPNTSVLARAAWGQAGWRDCKPFGKNDRFIPSEDFWRDWATIQFGQDAGEKIGGLFAKIDCQLPRPSDWVNGPGGIKPDPRPWAEVGKEYTFVDDLAAMRSLVKGPASLDRFDYWLNQLQYLRAVAHVNCIWAKYNEAMAKMEAEKDAAARKRLGEQTAVPLRKELVAAVKEVYGYLLSTVSNTGEMGMIVNWEQHLLPTLLDEPGEKLAKLMEWPVAGYQAMAVGTALDAYYEGHPRMFVPEVRTNITADESLSLKVIVLDGKPAREVAVHWRPLGGEYSAVPARHVARGVWTVTLPSKSALSDTFEYYVTALTDGGQALHFPVTAPEVTQTVVVMPPK